MVDDLELLEWDGRFYGSMVREWESLPLGGWVLFMCGCDWRENGSGTPCRRHRLPDCECAEPQAPWKFCPVHGWAREATDA